jgi:hypothetical protein
MMAKSVLLAIALAVISLTVAVVARGQDQVDHGLLTVAQAWWAANGQSADCPDGVTATVVELPPGMLGRAPVGGGCWMQLDADLVGNAAGIAVPPAFQRRAALLLCLVALHEYGHDIGLQHTPTGVMAPNADTDHAPAVCVAWAIANTRRIHGAHR